MKIWIYIVCLISSCFIQAQDSLTIIDQVIELSNNNNRNDALSLIQEYMPKYKLEERFEDYITLQRLKAVIYSAIKPPADAVVEAKRAVALAKQYLEPSNYEYVESNFTLGRVLTYNFENEKALKVLNDALDLLKGTSENEHQKAKILSTIAQVYTVQRSFEKSIEYAKRALNIKLKEVDSLDSYLGPIYQTIGDNYNYSSKYDTAAFYYQMYHKTNLKSYVQDHPNIGISHNSLAAVYWNLGQLDRALKHYREAEDVFYQDFLITGNGRYLSIIWSNLGLLYQSLGEYQLSADYSKKGLDMAIKDFGPDNMAIINTHILYGSAANDCQNFEAANKSYKEAERIQMLTAPNEKNQVAFLHAKLVDHLMRNERYDKAERYALSSLEHYKSIGDESKFHLNLLSHLSTIMHNKGNIQKAESFVKDAIVLSKKIYGLQQIKTIQPRSNLAELYIDIDRLIEAENILDEISKSSGNNSSEYVYSHLPATPDILDIYEIHAQLLYKKHVQGIQVIDQLNRLITDFDKIYNSKQSSLTEANSIQRLNHKLKSFYDICINIFIDQGDIEAAKDLCDAYKANFLNAILNNRLINEAKLFPDSTVNTILNYEHKISELQERIEQDSKDSLNQFIELIRLKESLTDYKRSQSLKHSQYYTEQHRVKTQKEHSLLKENELMIQYYYSVDQLIMFYQTSNTIQHKLLDKEKVDSLLSLVTTDRLCSLSNFKKLRTELLPIDLSKENLLVVPDGKLFHLSFESLIDEKDKFLVENHNIRYAYSQEILQVQESLAKHIRSDEILSVTPGFTQENKAYYKSSIDSLKIDSFYLQILQQPFMLRVADQLRQNNGSKDFTNLDATELNFKSNKSDVRLIHLGTHGVLNDRSPMMSYLIFSQSPTDTLEDGYLHTYEVYNQKLNAELTVLAACQTGVSNINGGESIQSLSHAFTYAGCPSVVMSLWKIDEKANAQILESFYKELEKGQTKSQALQNAKMKFISSAPKELRHPYYWSGLVLLGADKPIDIGSAWNWYLLLLIPVLIYLFFWFKANRQT